MQTSRVLVTGATGFLGPHLVRQLVAAGWPVKILVRRSSSLRMLADVRDRIEVAEGDITVGHTVYRALMGCDRLFHVAANFQMWDRDPKRILDASIIGTREVLAAARLRGVRKIVVTSSVAAVGATDDPNRPMDESFAFNREDSETYIVAKWRAEQIALDAAASGQPVVVVNPSGIFGPGDWRPTPSGDSILTYLRWPLPFGVPCTPGGINVVDVEDVARGHVLAMEKGKVGERYILGGENLTYEQLFRTLSELTGLPGPGRETSRSTAMFFGRVLEAVARVRGGEPKLTYKLARDFVGSYAWVTSAKAERELGYTHRPARATLLRAVRWYLEHGYLSPAVRRRIHLDLRASA